MRVLAWNVRGKLLTLSSDPAIMQLLSHADVLLFSETGCSCMDPGIAPPPIPGYTCVNNAPRPLQPHCGGVACYVRDSFSGLAKPGATHPNDGIAWICLRLTGLPPLSIAVCYFPCESSKTLNRPGKHSKDDREEVIHSMYTKLATDVANLQDHTTIIAGDFNARTGTAPELDPAVCADWEHMMHAGVEAPLPTHLYQQTLQTIPPRASLDTTRPNAWGRQLLSFCSSTNLIIANGRLPGKRSDAFTYEMARARSTARSTIDYFLVAPGILYDDSGQLSGSHTFQVVSHDTLPAIPSKTHDRPFDHAPIILSVELPISARTHSDGSSFNNSQPSTTRTPVPIKWDEITRAKYAELLRCNPDISSRLYAMVCDAPDSETASALLCEALTLAVSKLRPRRKARHNNRCNAWFTDACKKARQDMVDLVHEHGRDSNIARVSRANYLQLLRTSKRECEQRILAETVAKWYEQPKQFWRSYKGQRLTCPITDVTAWTTYFSNLFAADNFQHSWEGGSPDLHLAHYSSLFPTPTPEQLARASVLNGDITVIEVLNALEHMQAHKAAGVDDIPAEMLKYAQKMEARAPHLLAPCLAHLFNQVLRGTYPLEWGQCAVAPVYKGKGSTTDMDSYRGIAVGTATSKLFSTIITHRLSAWAEREGFRAAGQAGFRPERGTPDNIFVLQHALERARLQGERVHAAFIDFAKHTTRLTVTCFGPPFEAWGYTVQCLIRCNACMARSQ